VPMAGEPRVPLTLHRSRLKAEEKTLDFEFEVTGAQFNRRGRYALRLTVENPLLRGSGAGVQLRNDDGEVIQSSTGTTDTIEQSDLNQICSFQKKKFTFTLPRGFCKNDKNHDVRLHVEALRFPGRAERMMKRSRLVGEAFFAIYPRTNQPRMKVSAGRDEDWYRYSAATALLRVGSEQPAMHCGRLAFTASLHEHRPPATLASPPPLPPSAQGGDRQAAAPASSQIPDIPVPSSLLRTPESAYRSLPTKDCARSPEVGEARFGGGGAAPPAEIPPGRCLPSPRRAAAASTSPRHATARIRPPRQRGCSEKFVLQMFRDVHPPDVQPRAVISRCSSHLFLPRNTISILYLPRNAVSISGAAERDLSRATTSRKAACLFLDPRTFSLVLFPQGTGRKKKKKGKISGRTEHLPKSTSSGKPAPCPLPGPSSLVSGHPSPAARPELPSIPREAGVPAPNRSPGPLDGIWVMPPRALVETQRPPRAVDPSSSSPGHAPQNHDWDHPDRGALPAAPSIRGLSIAPLEKAASSFARPSAAFGTCSRSRGGNPDRRQRGRQGTGRVFGRGWWLSRCGEGPGWLTTVTNVQLSSSFSVCGPRGCRSREGIWLLFIPGRGEPRLPLAPGTFGRSGCGREPDPSNYCSHQPPLPSAKKKEKRKKKEILSVNYHLALRRMAGDLLSLRRHVASLEVENGHLRRSLASQEELGRALLDDVDLDVMTREELLDRLTTLKRKLVAGTAEMRSLKDRVQQLQNELIRKNDREKDLVLLQRAHRQQQAMLRRCQEKVAKTKGLEETVRQQQKVIEAMERMLQEKLARVGRSTEKPAGHVPVAPPPHPAGEALFKEAHAVLLAENRRLREELARPPDP
ncbi:CCD33 protein, partial [Aramus guarauna]|nr:CCD33 protein [Aramus guarauna]